MSEKICLATLKILLTPKEMKNVLGGSDGEVGPMCGGKACSDASDCKDILTQRCGCIEGGKKYCY